MCVLSYQAHFDAEQYEQKRQDGLKRLRPNAVPLLFHHTPTVRSRKPPSKRSPYTSPTKLRSAKRVKLEHCYSKSSDLLNDVQVSSGNAKYLRYNLLAISYFFPSMHAVNVYL